VFYAFMQLLFQTLLALEYTQVIS